MHCPGVPQAISGGVQAKGQYKLIRTFRQLMRISCPYDVRLCF